MKPIWYARALLVAAFIALLLAWWWIPSVNLFVHNSLGAFLALDQQGIERFIHSYGSQAAVVSFLLMIFQAIACIFDHLRQRLAVWRLLGRRALLEQRDGRGGALFLYRPPDGPRRG